MNEIARIGGTAVPILGYGPVTHTDADCRENTTLSKMIPHENDDDWAGFVEEFVGRYGQDVDHYEIWNEPDWYPFFEGTVERFARILTIADSVVAVHDPSAETILGGLALPLWQGSTWLDKLLDQPGQPCFDIIGVHGYRSEQLKNLWLVDQAYTAAGLNASVARIWITETGDRAIPRSVDAAHPKVAFATERTQEAYVYRALSRWADPRVEAVFWYNGWDREPGFTHGLLDSSGQPRPAFHALTSWTPKSFDDEYSVGFDADFVNRSAAGRYGGVYPVTHAAFDAGGLVTEFGPFAYFDATAPVGASSRGFAQILPSIAPPGLRSGMYFGVEDAWRYNEPQDYVVAVTFKGDSVPDFRVRYAKAPGVPGTREYSPEPPEDDGPCDPPDPDVERSAEYPTLEFEEPSTADWSTGVTGWFEFDPVVGGPAYAPDEGGLRTATFVLEDAALGNGGLFGTDFSIELRADQTDPLWLASVTVSPRAFAPEEPIDVGLNLVGAQPYSVLNLDYNEDGHQDLLFTVAARTDALSPLPLVFAGQQPAFPGVANFADLPEPFMIGDGQSARGATYAHLRSGAELSLLLATPATNSELFSFENGQFQPDPAFTLPVGVWAGSFADMDLDGDMDLYLARSSDAAGSGSEVTATDIAGQGLPDQLLEYRYGSYVDVSATALPSTGNSETVAATWADVNGDRFPDLYVSYLGTGATSTDGFQWSPLYINQRDGTFVDESYDAPDGSPVDPDDPPTPVVYTEGAAGELGREGIHRLTRVSGARFVDLDNDGDLDFVATRDSDAGNRGLISLISRHQDTGFFDDLGSAQVLEPERDAVLIDVDNNGVLDFVAAPPAGSVEEIAVLLGEMDALGGVSWVDASALAGLTPGAAGGVNAADYDGDGDTDLVLGRESDEFNRAHYYFSNTAGAAGKEIRVELDAEGSGNPELGIGARVYVTADGVTQMKQFSGGDGRGSQQTLVAQFGIGEAISASIDVEWPDGSVQDSTVAAGTLVKFTDDHAPELDPASVGVTLDLDPTYVVMHFEWETLYATSSNTVRIEKTSGDSPCMFGYTGAKGSGSSTIEFKIEDSAPAGFSYERVYDFDSQFYVHRLNYQRDCAAPCNYRYKVISVSANRIENSGWKTLGIPGCVIIQP